MDCFGRNVLVLGGTGFIGCNLVDKLIAKGFNVYVLVRPNSSNGIKKLQKFKGLNYIKCQVKDLLLMDNLPQFDICFNLSAYGLDYSKQDIDEMIDSNIRLLLYLIDFCSINKTRLLVHTGTCYEYGNNNLLLTENTEINPNSLYSSSKAAGITLGTTYGKLKNVKMIVVRPFGIYGPSEAYHKFIPQIISTIINKGELDLTLGEQIRDYLYVSDLVEGYIELALNNKVNPYESYNLCSKKGVSLKEIVNILCDISGFNIDNFHFGAIPYRPMERMCVIGDNSKVISLTNWKPTTSIEEGLGLTLNWYKNNRI